MNNYQNEGDTLTLTAPSGGVVSGTPVLIGRLVAVPVDTVAETLSFAGVVEGVFSGMAKATSQAWSEGDALFWDDSAKKFTKTSAGNTPCGFAAEAAGSSATTGTVKLDPMAAPSAGVDALTGTLTGSVDGVMEDVAATAGSCAGGSSPTAANVDTAIATAVASIVTGVNLQLKELETKLNELIAAL